MLKDEIANISTHLEQEEIAKKYLETGYKSYLRVEKCSFEQYKEKLLLYLIVKMIRAENSKGSGI